MLIFSRFFDIVRKNGFLFLLKKLLKRFLGTFYPLFLPYWKIKIKKFKPARINELISFVFNELGGIIQPMQIREEIYQLLKILAEKKPKIILEIGTANGGTLFLFSRMASGNSTIISVDLPGGMFGGGYPKWKISLYKSFSGKNQKIHLVREGSHKKDTFTKIKKILKDERIDFLFIDGDHSYEGVKKDFQTYKPLVKKGGLVAFHDIAPNGSSELVGGVPVFWGEIKSQFKFSEHIEEINQNGFGIGVIYL